MTDESPFGGVPGRWVQRNLEQRRNKILACLAVGPPEFERMSPVGYSRTIERCSRCKVLKRFHKEILPDLVPDPPASTKRLRGFAAMTPERRRALGREGGFLVHETGRARVFTSEEAVVAGRKGGVIAHQTGRARVFTSEEAAIAGRRSGVVRGSKTKESR